MVRATRSKAAAPAFNLSFNEIVGYTPGQGRGDAQKGMYENAAGDVLVVFSKNPQFVKCETRKNGKRTNKTGFTRTGMAMVSTKTGSLRLVTCDEKPDGEKKWKKYEGSITLAGNPHVVNAPGGDEDDDE